MNLKKIKNFVFKNVTKNQLSNINILINDIKEGKESLSSIRSILSNDLQKNAFLNLNGRNYELGSYVEMLTRTELMNSHVNSTVEIMKENNLDLIITSQHADSSQICLPWQNEILSLTGKTPSYKTLSEAIESGYHHPNCRHLDFPYIPEIAIIPEDFSKNEAKIRDAVRNEQRYLERQIRNWKSKEIIGIEGAEEKVKIYQKRIRDLIDNNPFLKRQYFREII